MLQDLKPVSKISLSDEIVQQLTELLARGVLKPGDRIPSEKQLCRQFGVGRTSVREAVKSLAAMGILESHAGDGTFVAANTGRCLERAFEWSLLLDRKLVTDLADTRLMLESHTAYQAASRATPEDLVDIEAAIRGMEESLDDPEGYLDHDLRFHLAVAQATHNTILHTLLGTIRGHMQVWIRQTLASSPPEDATQRAKVSVKEHRKILEALERRQPEAAREAMTAHILSAGADLYRRLGGSDV